MIFVYFASPLMKGGVVFMTNIDKKIEKIGYKIRRINRRINSIVYENIYQDQEITIEWNVDDQDCFIFSNTITEQRNWYGQLYKEPMGLTISEIQLFMSKIQELRLEES